MIGGVHGKILQVNLLIFAPGIAQSAHLLGALASSEAGVEIGHENFAWAKRRYYQLMKWDPGSSIPSQTYLPALELERVLETVMP